MERPQEINYRYGGRADEDYPSPNPERNRGSREREIICKYIPTEVPEACISGRGVVSKTPDTICITSSQISPKKATQLQRKYAAW